ncbi:hypothetical protein D3C71_1764650 [compost metagenome]
MMLLPASGSAGSVTEPLPVALMSCPAPEPVNAPAPSSCMVYQTPSAIKLTVTEPGSGSGVS